jgi:endo-1,4-beta-xylanase
MRGAESDGWGDTPQPEGPTSAGDRSLTRRSFLFGAAGAAAAGLIGCSGSVDDRSTAPPAGNSPAPVDCPALDGAGGGQVPLWQTALERGLIYGSSTATWQLSDAQYRRLFERQAAILFTEDDLLWYRLRPTPTSGLDFKYGDQIIGFANRNGMLVLGAHLVWDQGFGEGWTDDDVWGISEQRARHLIFDTIDSVVKRYRGQVTAWIVANEVLDDSGLRTNVPWYNTIGPGYVAESFNATHDADPDATLLLNDFGYETDDGSGSAAGKRAATLEFLDRLLDDNVPVHVLGVQAHLQAGHFAEAFDADAYRRFLTDVADRGLRIVITELDVLDDGLPAKIGVRDRAVADVVRRYLDAALDEPAVAALVTFGLSDRYTWLQEDFPRDDGAARRPLPFDQKLRPKPACDALETELDQAPARDAPWAPPRC